MHLWILSHYASPPTGSGTTRHAGLARYLHEAGHSVVVFSSALGHNQHGGNLDVPDGMVFVDREYDGVLFRFVRTRPYHNASERFLNNMSFRANALRSTGRLPRPDVVIGSSVHLHAADAGLRLARRHGAKFVAEIRDIWPETLVDLRLTTRWSPVYWYLRALELRVYRNAELIIGLMPGLGDYLEGFKIPSDRFLYVPNGFDPARFPELGPPPAKGPFVCSLFGSHAPSDGIVHIVRAAEILQRDPRGEGIRVRLVGEGPCKPDLMRLAGDLGLRNIEFCDVVPKPELLPIAETTHAFIYNHPYMPIVERYGMSPNKIFEYLAMGRPVLAACKSLNDPVREAGAGLTVAPGDPQALAEGMIALRDTAPDEWAAMGRRGREYAMENHDLRKLASKIEKRLVEIL